MNKKRMIVYMIITLIFILCVISIIQLTDLNNNVMLSKSIQIILILFLIRIAIGCSLYIREQYDKKKYSYEIIMNLGLLLFIIVNILRQIELLIKNWNVLSIVDIYSNTLRTFSYFMILILPCIFILAIYSIITNLVLIKKEGFQSKRLLGVLLGIIALISLIGSQSIYLLTKMFISDDNLLIKYAIDICINASFSYLYTLIVATLYCNIKAARHKPKYDKDFIIILGSKINNDGTLTPLLKGRVDKAIEFGIKQYKNNKKEIIYIPSGGQGSDEIISEAEAIKNYLIDKGVKKTDIIIEDKSSNTYENMKYSKEIIDSINKDGKLAFSTTNYHVFRSGVIANNQGIDIEGMGSKTKWYFYSNALIREFIANIVIEKKNHLILLLLINISLLVLIYIGYHFNLLNII